MYLFCIQSFKYAIMICFCPRNCISSVKEQKGMNN